MTQSSPILRVIARFAVPLTVLVAVRIFLQGHDLPGGGCVALTNFIPDEPSAAAGGTIAFEVENLDALIADLKSKGTTFRGDVVHGPNCRMITCLDTEGNSIILHQLNPKS